MKFEEKVWSLIKQIPRGKVTTYKAIAEKLGNKAYRVVGSACKRNPRAPEVPCHRVVNSSGFVGSYSGNGGKKAKIELLRKEGIKIEDEKIQNFSKVLVFT